MNRDSHPTKECLHELPTPISKPFSRSETAYLASWGAMPKSYHQAALGLRFNPL